MDPDVSCTLLSISHQPQTTSKKMTARRKSGGSDPKYYEATNTVQQFERIKDDLTRDLQKSQQGSDFVAITAKELAHFTHALQQFQEDVLGINHAATTSSTSSPSLPARIPAKMFRIEDAVTTDSPIYKTLKAAYEYRNSQAGWRRWDFGSPAKRSQHMDLVLHIRRELIAQGLVKNPLVAFDDSVEPEEREKLQTAVDRLGGKTKKNADERETLHLCMKHTQRNNRNV